MSFPQAKEWFKPDRLAWCVPTVCFALLVGMVLTSPARPCYDEMYHLQLTKEIKAHGWRPALLSQENHTAAGPLYPAIHLALSPITNIQAPAVRWINLVCLGFVILLLPINVAVSSKDRWVTATSVISVPFLWPASGMALTELPALVAFTLFTMASYQFLKSDDVVSMRSIAFSCVAGLALGLAILGRQTYLIVLPGIIALMFFAPARWLELSLCAAIALLSCGWLFVFWHGVVPPSQQHVASGLRLGHGVLSLSYVAGATLFLNPKWMKPRSRLILISSLAVGMILAVLSRDYANPPAKSLLFRIMGERLALCVGFVFGAGLAVLGVLWAFNATLEAWQARDDRVRLFTFLILFLLVAAPIMVSHLFSARYVVGLLGLLVVVVSSSNESVLWRAARMAAGSLIGAATLWTYYR